MPCQDITEEVEVILDGEDCLSSYRFNKRTCGQGVGEASLLLEWLGGRGAESLMAIQGEDFLDEFEVPEGIEEFLTLKHLFAIQGALAVLLGHEPGGPGDAFTANSIEVEGSHTVIRGEIAIELLTEKIEACGNCRGCGKNAPTA